MEEGKESVKDLVVEVSSSEVSIALMENHRLIEFNKIGRASCRETV